VKVLKGPIYEHRLAEYATVFADNQKEIESALIMHTSLTLESAMHTLLAVNEKVTSTDEKFNLILLFRRLDSPQEAELIRFVEAKGGPEKCMKDDGVLLELTALRKRLQRVGASAYAPAELGPGAGPSADYWQNVNNAQAAASPQMAPNSPGVSPYIPVSFIKGTNT